MKKDKFHDSPVEKTDKSEDRFLSVTWWLIIFGMIVLFSYVYMKFEFEWRLGSEWDIAQTLPSQSGVLGLIVFLVIGVVATFLTRGKKKLFSKQELATIYIALSVCGVVWQVGKWLPLALGSLPLTVIEDSAIWSPVLDAASPLLFPLQTVEEAEAFYWGDTTAPFRQWLIPMLLWGIFTMAVGFLFVSLSILIRRHWMETMRFTWPYMTPITSLVQGESEDFSMKDKRASRLFIVGLSIGFLLIFFEWVANVYPIFPFFSNLRTLDGATVQYANIIRGLFPYTVRTSGGPLWYLHQVQIWPTVFGIAYLIPLNLMGSFIFVTLGKYVIGVAFALYGITAYFPATGKAQSWFDLYTFITFGGGLALAVMSIYRARYMILEFFRMPNKESYEQEGISSRFFIICLGISLLFIIVFMVIGLHLPILLVLSLLLIVVLWAITAARFRAEIGVPISIPPLSPARHYLPNLVGGLKRFGGPFTQRAFYLLGARVIEARDSAHGMFPLVGHTLDAHKLGEDAGIKTKHVIKIILVTTAFSILVAFYGGVTFLYSSPEGAWGARYWAGWQGPVSTWRYGPMFFDELFDLPQSIKMVSLTFILGIFLIGMRSIFSWWPLHPVGALMGASDITYKAELLVPFIIVGIIKFIIFRYFGNKTYKTAKPLFIGLIIGPVIGTLVVILLQFMRFILH